MSNVFDIASDSTLIRIAEAFEKQVRINEKVDFSGSPGNDTLYAGDTNAGFLGFVTADELFTGAQIATEIGLSSGTLINTNTPWIKYIWKGEICFTPLKPIRHSSTWDAIYNTGSVYGSGDEGFLPPRGRLGVGLSIDGADNSINTATQHFLAGTDASDLVGEVGDTLVLKGWSNSVNNGSATIVSITNSKIVLDKSLSTEAGGLQKRFYNQANAVTQNRVVTKNNLDYRVTLFKGANENPTNTYSASDRGGRGPHNEWNWVMGQLHEQARLKNWAHPAYMDTDLGDFGVYLSDADMVTHQTFGAGNYTWCQEVRDDTSWRRVLRGTLGVSFLNANPSWFVGSIYGFRPVLRLSRTATL